MGTVNENAKEQAPARGGRSRVLAGFAIASASLVAAMIVASRGRFRELIAEFDIPFTLLTAFALGRVLPIFLATMLVVTMVKELFPLRGSIINAWNGCVICLSAAGLALYVAGVFAPLLMLIESLA